MITSISHLTFIVSNIERASLFFCEGLGAKEVYDSDAKNYSISREKFFTLGGVWLVAMEGIADKPRSYQHVAFRVSDEDLPSIILRLKRIGVEFKTGRSRVAGEAQSVYFYDFDNNLFELHTGSLDVRLAAYSKQGEL